MWYGSELRPGLLSDHHEGVEQGAGRHRRPGCRPGERGLGETAPAIEVSVLTYAERLAHFMRAMGAGYAIS